MAVDGHLNFDTKIDTKGFVNGLNKINQKFINSAADMKAALDMVISSFRTLVSNCNQLMSVYQTQIESETKLAATMRNSTSATNAQIQSVKDLASALQEVGVVGDEVQLAGAQELATYVENVESIKTMLPVLDDMIAQQYGFSASTDSAVTIATMLGKVLQGQTSALSRYGYSFDEAQEQLLKYGTEEQRVATLAEVVEESVSGVNKALADTPTGKVKQLSNDFGDLKETLGKLVTETIYPLVIQLDIIVKKLNEVFATASRGIKAVFGINDDVNTGSGVIGADDSTAELADVSGETADNFSDIADSAEEAAKANKESLAAFDELNVLSQDDTSPLSFDTDSAENELDNITSELADNSGLTLPVSLDTSDFDSRVDTFIQTIKNKWEEIKTLCEPLKQSFEELQGTLQTVGGFAGENLTNFYEHFLKPLGEWTLGEGLPKLVDIIDKTLKNIDFEKVNDAFDKLYKVLEPFAEHIGEGLLWFCDNVLSPFASWTIGEALPAFLDTLSGFFELVDSIGQIVGTTLKLIWDNFLSKVASFVGDAIVGFLETFGQFLSDVAENQTAVTTLLVIAEVIATIIAAIKLIPAALKGIPAVITALSNPVGWIIVAIAAIIVVIIELITYWDTLKEAWLEGVQYIKQSIKSFIDKWKSGVEDIKNSAINLWNGLKDGAKNAWEGVKSVFGKVAEFFGNVFSNAWNKVKEVFSKGGAIFVGIKDGIVEAFKRIVNSLIDAINSIVRVPFDGINSALDGIRGVEIAGWQPFDWLPTIDIPQIPRLATGTVVPANYGEFAAVLGDNKREPEVVSPLSTMKQALSEVLAESGLLGGSSDGDIVIQIDGREVFRAVKRENDVQKRRHGGISQLA